MADNPNHCDPLSRMSRPEILESSPVPLLQVVAPLARFFVDERAPEVGEPRLLRRYLVLTNDMAGGHHRPFPATTTFVSVLSAAPLLVPLELVSFRAKNSLVVQGLLQSSDEIFCIFYPARYPYKAIRDAQL